MKFQSFNIESKNGKSNNKVELDEVKTNIYNTCWYHHKWWINHYIY